MTVLLSDPSTSAPAQGIAPGQPAKLPARTTWYATPSQQAGLKRLHDLAEVFIWSGHELRAGIKPLTRCLLIGESGSGKSRLAREFAKRNEWPLLAVDCGSWLPQGAIAKPPTLRLVRDYIRSCGSSFSILYLDEICKLLPEGESAKNSWSLSCWSEWLALSDCDSRLRGHEWTDQDIQRLRDYCFVIGGGAFTSSLREARACSKRGDLGFNTRGANTAAVTYSGKIRENLPEEVFSRFHPTHVVLEAPSRNDYAAAIERIHEELGVPRTRPIKELLDAAQSSPGGMRWAEAYLADVLIAFPDCVPAQREQEREPSKTQEGINFFTGDSIHYAREATEASFQLRAVLARLLAELYIRHPQISSGGNEAFADFVYGKDGNRLKNVLTRALNQANACADVLIDDSRVTDPILAWRKEAWTGLTEHPAELTWFGMIGMVSRSWDLATRTCELRGHISTAVAAGRYASWGQS